MEEKLFVKRGSAKISESRRKWLIGVGGGSVLLVIFASWLWFSGYHGSSDKMLARGDKVVKEIPKAPPSEEPLKSEEATPPVTAEERPQTSESPQSSLERSEPSTTSPSQGETVGSFQETPQAAVSSQEATEDQPEPAETTLAANQVNQPQPEAEGTDSAQDQTSGETSPVAAESAQAFPADEVKPEERASATTESAQASLTDEMKPQESVSEEVPTPQTESQTVVASEGKETGVVTVSQESPANQNVPQGSVSEKVRVAKIESEALSSPDRKDLPVPVAKTETEQKRVSKPKKPVDGQASYIVRLGSFRVKENANQMYNMLKEKGYDVEMGVYRHSKLGNLHTVQLKPIDDIPRAQLLISQIKKEENINAFMVKEISR